MNKTRLALVAAAMSSICALAHAADAAPAPAPAPDWTITGNAGLFSDYRFRGISQTNKKPAFQGGFDIAHSSGFYVGNWNSNVDAAFYNGANIEMDFYGGYKVPVGDVTLDFGALYYYYPGSGTAGLFKIDNTEVYVGASYGAFSAKYSVAVSDFFGVNDSKNCSYLDLGYSYDLGNGFGLNAHLGYQRLKGNAKVVEINGSGPQSSITDYKLGATYTTGNGFVVGLAYISTNRDLTGGVAAFNNRNISNGTAVLSLSKSF